jgi:perosamine synthetase
VKIARMQPPVGYRLGVRTLIEVATSIVSGRHGAVGSFFKEFSEYCGGRHVFGVSSGKAALTLILTALHELTGRKKVIFPAYTCYSVPSAIVKAGLDVVPCDVSPDSFDYDYDQLVSLLASQTDVLAVLSVHLLGIPSNTPRLNELCRGQQIFVVEDAAQALGGWCGNRALGSIGDVAFYSLGRGKNVTCGTGGLIVTSSDAVSRALAHVVGRLEANGRAAATHAWLTMALLSIFMSPRLYWLPAGLPFLRLGETIFYDDFPIRRLSEFELMLLGDWRALLASLNETRQRNGAFYAARIDRAMGANPTIPYLRFPVHVGRRQKTRILDDQRGKALGLSGMYPTSVARIPRLAGRLDGQRFPEADRVAESLITLPTHPLVSDRDRAGIVALVNQFHDSAAAPAATELPVNAIPNA